MKLIGYIWSMNIFALQRGEACDVQPACDVEDKDGYIPIYIDEEEQTRLRQERVSARG